MYYLRSTFLVLVFGVQVFSQANALSYPTAKTEGMVGFAKMGGVTGGSTGSVVEINNLADLQKYIGDNIARVLVVNSNIKASTRTKVILGSNKSIIGSFQKPTLHNIYLKDNNASGNIIIQNLIFQHDASIKGDDDIQIRVSYTKKYWIDHCSFVGHKWSPNDGSADKLLYFGEIADYVTISNCYFGNHQFGLIFGYPTDDNFSNKKYDVRVTLCNNYFENFYARAPGLFRYGQYHVYNNYVRNFHLGFTVAKNGKVISENNCFENYTKARDILDDYGTGQFTDKGSVPTTAIQKSQEDKWSPLSQYKYTLKNAAAVKTFLPTHAGAQSTQLVF